jgi:hypothetical protein
VQKSYRVASSEGQLTGKELPTPRPWLAKQWSVRWREAQCRSGIPKFTPELASEATAGIEPAMKVLQTSRKFSESTIEFLSDITNCAPG